MVERKPEVKNFSYAEDVLDELEASLSHERLGTYLDASEGDREAAIRLYAWNTAASAAFYGPLQGLEVALRNTMYRRLAEHYGDAWYDNRNAGLDRGAKERITSARTELARDAHGDNPPRIVAALSFGFWVSLLGPGGRIGAERKANYEMTLWRPALRGAFAHRATLTRKEAHRPLNALRTLRNRIAHHEPIFARDLARDHGASSRWSAGLRPGPGNGWNTMAGFPRSSTPRETPGGFDSGSSSLIERRAARAGSQSDVAPTSISCTARGRATARGTRTTAGQAHFLRACTRSRTVRNAVPPHARSHRCWR